MDEQNISRWITGKNHDISQFIPNYGDLTDLNKNQLILKNVGKKSLSDISSYYLNLLETSTAIYEKNGDYALGIFSSNWCRFLDQASRALCETDDNEEALKCGKWLCHESCWTDVSKKAIEKDQPIEVVCNGGLNLYALPIKAGGKVIGSINIGYGDPPKELKELEEISKNYRVSINKLIEISNSYNTRPPFIIEIAKQQLHISAKLIGNLIQLRQTEQKLIYEQNFLSNIFSSIKDGLCIIDLDYNIIKVNPAITGWFPELQIPPIKKCYETFFKKEKPCEDCICNELIETGQRVICEKVRNITLEDHSSKIFNVCSFPLIEPISGKVSGIIKYLQDVTERKKAEQDLKTSKERLKFLITNNPAIIYTSKASDDYGATFISENVKDLTGYSPEDFTSDPEFWINHIHPNDRERIISGLSNLFERGYHTHEYRFQIKDGNYHWMRDELKLIKNAESNPIEILGYWVDITDQKKAEEILKQSEEQFQMLYETMTEGVVLINKNGNIIFANPAAEEILGLKLSDIEARHYISPKWEILRPDGTPLPTEEMAGPRAMKTRSIVKNVVMGIKRSDDKISWVNVSAAPLIDDNNKLFGVVGTFTDISEQKLAKEKLTKSEEKFKFLISSSPTMIYTSKVSGDFGATFISKNVNEIAGYNPEDFINNSEFWIEHVHTDDKERVLSTLEELFEKEALIYDYRFKFADGTYHWMRDEVKLIKDKDGNPIETIGSWTDISDIKKAEEELIHLNKLKSELLTRASHELKTPLISIKGYSDLLLELHKDKFNGMALSSIKQIKRGCETLEKTVNNILNTAYLESDHVKLNLTVENLSFLIKFVINDLKGLALTRNHEIIVDILDNMVLKIEKERIYDVLSNLIVNAIKYTPQGGQIKIKSKKKNGSYLISVKDNGIGFTKEEKEQIFEQFGKIERYGQGWDIGIEGTGLGLYISKRIIKLHGGNIWVESKGRNMGSTFYFSLPIS